MRRPPVPRGSEWLGDVVRHEVDRATAPIRDALNGLMTTIERAIVAVRDFARAIVAVAIVLGLLLGMGLLTVIAVGWQLLATMNRLGRLLMAAARVLEAMKVKS